MSAYYNEHDPRAAAWLRELIRERFIAPGDVDERSIADVAPADVMGYTQCHWFAGVGVWSYALRLAGWPDDRPVWTGSCPCQPFSVAGKRRGIADVRHLWPNWLRLIETGKPMAIFGEQVSNAATLGRIRRKTHNLQSLLDREALRRVSYALYPEEISRYVSGLPECSGAEAQSAERHQNGRITSTLANTKQRFGAGIVGEVSGARAQPPVRFRRSSDTGAHRRRKVRADGDSIRFGGRLECSIVGSNSSGSGLFDDEYAGSSQSAERDDEHVGLGKSVSDRACVEGEAEQDGGEQLLIAIFSREIETSDGAPWFDIVQSDLERAHYTVRSCSAPACGFGAPHIRQRLFFVADAGRKRGQSDRYDLGAETGDCGRVARQQRLRSDAGAGSHAGELGDAQCEGLEERELRRCVPGRTLGASTRQIAERGSSDCRPVATNGFWRAADWLLCRDERWRPVEPKSSPLAHGAPARVGRLRGYGNAICAEVAAEFIAATMTHDVLEGAA